MKRRECENCVWFAHVTDPENCDATRPVIGECKRRAPKLGEAGRGEWPHVLTVESCGEWEPFDAHAALDPDEAPPAYLCETCRWCSHHALPGGREVLTCRVDPPALMQIQSEDGDDRPWAVATQPRTEADWFCSRWEANR